MAKSPACAPRPTPGAPGIRLRLVDEYLIHFELPADRIEKPLTAEEVLDLFRDAIPNSTDTSCKIAFPSFFYPDLDQVAEELSVT